jgi:hypothetical protein
MVNNRNLKFKGLYSFKKLEAKFNSAKNNMFALDGDVSQNKEDEDGE